MSNWIEKLTGSLEQKKQYQEYKARMDALPAGYRDAGAALDRYIMHAGGIADGETLVRLCADLADLLEEHAANGTPVRDVVGDDPVEFAEDFLANYSDGHWLGKERRRLKEAIARIEARDE